MTRFTEQLNGTREAGASFRTTHWSVVLAAAQMGTPRADAALAKLCQTYWYPLYAFSRRFGHGPHQAEDLTQEFFSRLLDKNYLAGIEADRGKFRSYLLTLFKHFMANEHERAQAQKRGGDRTFVSIDASSGETRYQCEPVENSTPESLFERRWALTLLEQVMVKLRADYVAAGKAELFNQLRPFLSGAEPWPSHAELGKSLGLSEGAVTVAVHRLRKRYGQLLRAEIADTVAAREEIEAEIRHLIAVTSR